MTTKYKVNTGWSFLERTYYTEKDARDYVESLKKMNKKPKTASITKVKEEHTFIERIEL